MSVCATEEVLEPMAGVWQRLMQPLLSCLDAQLDRRLVATLSHTVRAILEHRHRAHILAVSTSHAHK